MVAGLRTIAPLAVRRVTFRPTIELEDGGSIINFVNLCYERYKLMEHVRRLPVVFDYLVQAERMSQPIELKLLIAFVTLENLKDTFARVEGIPFKKGYFRKVPKPKKESNRYSFEELLRLMLRRVSMRKGLKRVIVLRNEIIHSGVACKPTTWQWRMYEQLHDLIREYVLRLLNYRGHYLTYRSRGMGVKSL